MMINWLQSIHGSDFGHLDVTQSNIYHSISWQALEHVQLCTGILKSLLVHNTAPAKMQNYPKSVGLRVMGKGGRQWQDYVIRGNANKLRD